MEKRRNQTEEKWDENEATKIRRKKKEKMIKYKRAVLKRGWPWGKNVDMHNITIGENKTWWRYASLKVAWKQWK